MVSRAAHLAVAVRTWNVIEHQRQDLLCRTIDSLQAGGYPYDLALVDNGSTDGSLDLVRQLGGTSGAETSGRGLLGRGVNLAVERALTYHPDVVVFSDDDIAWHPGALATVMEFWNSAPPDVVIMSGFLEPMWHWNRVRGVVQAGAHRAVVRDTVPGGAWTFRAMDWARIGPVPLDSTHDVATCRRLTALGAKLCAMDLVDHIGYGRSAHDNFPAPGNPVDKELYGLA